MTQAKNSPSILVHLLGRSHVSKLVIGMFFPILLLLAACSPGIGTPLTNVPTTHAASPPQQSPVGGTASPIKVYFSKFPDSLNNNASVFPVDRSSPTTAVATFSIQLLIAGPTLSERDAGYFSELNSILSGPSSCSAPHPTGGPDFTLALDKKGSQASPGTATLRFCRATNSSGIGTDARIQSEINATLKQFTDIKNVVILTQSGNCFGDESGQNLCLK